MNKMILAAVAVAVVAVAAAGAFVLMSDDGEVDETANYTGISNSDELLAMEANGEYKLLNDIDMNGVAWDVKDFSGKLDGKGFAIVDLSIAGSGDWGLFNVMSGKVNNLTMKDILVQGNAAGAIAVKNTGTITNCKVTGEVIGSAKVGGIASVNEGTISSCTNEADILGTGEEVGGIVGNSAVSVSDCKNLGDVTGLSKVGGIAGTSKGISNSQNEGNIKSTAPASSLTRTGGVVGVSQGEIRGCTNRGNITATASDSIRMGGIAGEISTNADVKDNTNYGNVTGGNGVGGIAGLFTHSVPDAKNFISGNANEGEISSSNFTGGIIGLVKFEGNINAELTISGCENRAAAVLSSTKNHTGGIIGYIESAPADTGTKAFIIGCSNKADMDITTANTTVGGIVATIWNINIDVTNCTNSGKLKAEGSVGGIIGNYNADTARSGTVSGCENTGDLTAANITGVVSKVGGITGQTIGTTTVTFSGCSSTGVLSGPFDTLFGKIVGNPNKDA